MREEIKNNINEPSELERLYRNNKTAFRREFNLVYHEIRDSSIAQFWKARLNYEGETLAWGKSNELMFVILACFIAGLIAKIPDMTGLDEEFYYPRNIAFITFPLLAIYFAWKSKLTAKLSIIVSAAFVVSAVYINLLPGDDDSDTLILACLHLPLVLWATTGLSFIGEQYTGLQNRLDFLRYNADLLIMSALILIAGGLLTVITFGLFELIDVSIHTVYEKYVIVWGLASTPIVATYLVRTNPQLVGKVSPVIAKIFTPLVLVMLVVYLITLVFTGKDPYNDREFLLVFNALLAGVMALILFSIAEISKSARSRISLILLVALSAVTIIVNGVALSAIVFRISEWGMTPNRLAVLGSNILILINLLIVTWRLFRTLRNDDQVEKAENSIASFLPVYWAWSLFIVFAVPVIFNFI